jgi:HTH-type transcriptional repressor of NAD biosynthesis genes
MIEFGAAMLDKLTVVVSGKPTDEITVAQRYNWVCEFVEKNNWRNVGVIYHIDKSPTPINIDTDGTVLDVDFQLYWANEFSKMATDATHIVSSDKYGQVIADRMNLKWLPVDPDRENVEISATKIRKNPTKYFKYISDVAKPYYVKKVAIVGPESTGKSTLVKSLGKFLKGSVVHEYGRTISEAKKNDLDLSDFMDITYGQQALIDIAVRNATTPLVITDTEAFTTYLFSKVYLGELKKEILDVAADQEIDLYVVLSPNVNWVDDGTRVLGKQAEREQFFEDIVSLLEHKGANYVVVDADDFVYRHTQAATAIYKFTENILTHPQDECINNM